MQLGSPNGTAVKRVAYRIPRIPARSSGRLEATRSSPQGPGCRAVCPDSPAIFSAPSRKPTPKFFFHTLFIFLIMLSFAFQILKADEPSLVASKTVISILKSYF